MVCPFFVGNCYAMLKPTNRTLPVKHLKSSTYV